MIWLIALTSLMSYGVGAKSIFSDKYKPSIYSRIIWFFLSVNSFASVLALNNDKNVKLLAGLGLLGNLVILGLSLNKSQKLFGKTEFISSILLFASLAIWLFGNVPLINLSIGLIAHFIGGLPTYIKVIKDPTSEHPTFWMWFALASLITWAVADKSQIQNYLFPAYYTIFDGLMVILCLPKFRRNA